MAGLALPGSAFLRSDNPMFVSLFHVVGLKPVDAYNCYNKQNLRHQ